VCFESDVLTYLLHGAGPFLRNYKYISRTSANKIKREISVNIICKQYAIAQLAHWLNEPVLCFVFCVWHDDCSVN